MHSLYICGGITKAFLFSARTPEPADALAASAELLQDHLGGENP